MKPLSGHSVEVRRWLNVAPSKAFTTWTQAGHIARWWLVDPYVDPTVEIDLRVGGTFRFGMRPSDGEPFFASGKFREIEPPRRLVHTWRWEDTSMGDGETLVTIEFAEKNGGTELIITHSGFDDKELCEKHGAGWNACFDRFGRVLNL